MPPPLELNQQFFRNAALAPVRGDTPSSIDGNEGSGAVDRCQLPNPRRVCIAHPNVTTFVCQPSALCEQGLGLAVTETIAVIANKIRQIRRIAIN